MARSVKKYLKISKGQISKNLVERTDIGILDDSGQEITNFYDTKYGALQTVAGTEFMYNFGRGAKVKLHTIHLSNNKEATLAFDATNQKLTLFDYQGNQLDQISFPYITEENYERSNIAQQEDLILLATGDNPLIQIKITNDKLSYNIYVIPMSNILKTNSALIKPIIHADLYRSIEPVSSQEEANKILPTIDQGFPIGTYVAPNQSPSAPTVPTRTRSITVYQKQLLDNIVTWVGPMEYYPSQIIPLRADTHNHFNVNINNKYSGICFSFGGGLGGQTYTDTYAARGGASGRLTITCKNPLAVSGILGADGENSDERTIATPATEAAKGGIGFEYGEDGGTEIVNDVLYTGAGGGGSTAVVINNKTYHVSGGGGAPSSKGAAAYGGKGGGDKGGKRKYNTESGIEGNNATDDSVSENSYSELHGIDAPVNITTPIVKNLWDSEDVYSIYYPLANSWIEHKPTDYNDIQKPDTTFSNSAVAGIVSIKNDDGLFTIDRPDIPGSYDLKNYAEALLIGSKFNSESAIGVVQINSISGSVVYTGNTVLTPVGFKVTTIVGSTLVGFDKVYTKDDPAKGFKIELSAPAFSGALPNTNDNPTSDTNYPNLISFYQQRLVIFGTQYNQEQILFSNIGEYDNFTDDYLSTSAFQLVIGSDQKESIRAFCLNQGIQIFTNVSEWLMDAQTITRTTGFVRNSQMGTNGVKPIISANGTTLFCPKNGKGIIGFIYNEQSASYMTPYISMFTDLLDVEIRDLFLKRGRDSQDDTLLYICDANGNLIIGNYLQDHNIQGFCRRSATGVKFLQSVQNEENVLLLSSRAGYTTLERIDQSKNTAHSTRLFQYNQESGVITLELPQYQNTLLNVYDENGEFVDAYTCENNQITIPSKPQGISEIGYNIHQVFHSNPMNIGAITMTEYKSIARIDLALTSESRHDALTINKKYGRRKGNLVSYVRPQRPTRDCTFTIENDIYPVEILSMEVEIEY